MYKKIKFPLSAYVLHPAEAHVNGLGPLLLQGFVRKCNICGIVHLYYCWELWLFHLYESCAFRDRVLCIYKLYPNFCLCCQCHDICHYFVYIVNGSIFWGVFAVVAEIMISARSAARLGHWQVRGVAVDLKNHLAMFISDNWCWVDGGVIEKPHYIVVGLFYGFWLGCCKVAQGDQNCRIHGQGII